MFKAFFCSNRDPVDSYRYGAMRMEPTNRFCGLSRLQCESLVRFERGILFEESSWLKSSDWIDKIQFSETMNMQKSFTLIESYGTIFDSF